MTLKNTIKVVICSMLLTACKSNEMAIDQIAPMEQKSLINNFEVVPNENGFYYVDNQLTLNYYDFTNSKNLSLGLLDEKTSTYTYSYMSSTIYQYANYLYYLTNYTNAEGVSYSSVTRQTLDGKEIESIFDLDYDAIQFLIHNGYIICTEKQEDENYIIHIHDLSGKEKCTLEEEAYVDHLLADGDKIFYTTESNNSPVLKFIDCKDLTNHIVDIDFQVFLFENLNKISVYTCERKDSLEDTIIHASIIDMDTHKSLFNIDNAVVNYFDDNYIYTSSTNEKNMKYSIYDWSGNLVKEISPSEELLGNEYNTNNMFWKTNGSQIIRIVDKYIVASTTIEKTDHFYVCNIESGHCSFVK